MPGDRSVTEPVAATPLCIRFSRKKPVDAALVVGDGPLVVVRLGFPVVVEHLGELGIRACGRDLLGTGVRPRCRIEGRVGRRGVGRDRVVTNGHENRA
jgi:hypothetical protein